MAIAAQNIEQLVKLVIRRGMCNEVCLDEKGKIPNSDGNLIKRIVKGNSIRTHRVRLHENRQWWCISLDWMNAQRLHLIIYVVLQFHLVWTYPIVAV